MPTMTTTTTAIEVKRPIRADILEELRNYAANNNISQSELGQQLGVSSSLISRAFKSAEVGTYPGDADVFENRAADFLKNEPQRRALRVEYFETAFTKSVVSFLDTVRRTNDCGIAFSSAGKGKTVGVQLYAATNPLAVHVSVTKWANGAHGLMRLIWNSVDTRGWKGNTNQGDFLVSRFRGSNRLIVVDNAQRLSNAAREWLFDFHDETGCPIALVGNPEVLDRIRKNDQHFSRIGLRREIKGGSPKQDAAAMVRQLWPEALGHVDTLATQVIKEQGHMRALKKELLLARDLYSSGQFETYEIAFRAAHTQLVRDYQLAN